MFSPVSRRTSCFDIIQRYQLNYAIEAIALNCIPLHCSAAKPSDYNFLPLVTEEPGSSRKMIAIGNQYFRAT